MSKAIDATIGDVRVIEIDQVYTESSGSIVFYEGARSMPFSPKRVFFLYDIPAGANRGAHAHKECHQLLVAVSGSFEVVAYDGTSETTHSLKQPNQGLLIPPGIWAAEVNFSGGAICLVLASECYEEDDYIRDLGAFQTWKSKSN